MRLTALCKTSKRQLGYSVRLNFVAWAPLNMILGRREPLWALALTGLFVMAGLGRLACAAPAVVTPPRTASQSSREAAEDLLQAAELQADPVMAARAAILGYRSAHYHLARAAILYWQTLSPGDPQGNNLLILVDLETGHVHEALEVLMSLVRRVAHPRQAVGALLTLIGPRVPRAALFALSADWVEKAPDDPIAHWALAQVAAREHITGLAVRECRWLLAHDPDSVRARLALARAWINLGAIHRGERLLRSVVEKSQTLSPAFQLELANIDLLAHHAKAAETLYHRLAARKPPVPGAWLGLGWMALRAHHDRQAKADFTRLLEMNAANRTAAYFLGLLEDHAGHPQQAIAWYRFSAVGTHFLPAMLAIADIQMKQNPSTPALALKTLETAMRQTPVWAPRLALGASALLVRTGHVSRAEHELAQARKHWKTDTDLSYAQALLDIRLGHRKQAVRVLKTLVLHHPRDPLFLNALGYTWTLLGRRLDHARSLIVRALAEDPGDPAILDSLGWVDFKLKRWAGASLHLEEAHHLRPEETTIAFHWGRILWQTGHDQAARQVWLAALKRAPHDARLKEVLSWHPVKHP